MYDELVKRLRNCTSDTVEDCAGCPYQGGYKGTYCMNGLVSEAADAIEKLKQTVEQMKAIVICEAQHTEMFDERDKKFKVFEINLRQGRSNYYVSSSGNNIAECMYNNRHNCFDKEISICTSPFFWATVPKKIVYKYTYDKSMVQEMKNLVKEGKFASSLWYKKDLKNLKRLFFVFAHLSFL